MKKLSKTSKQVSETIGIDLGLIDFATPSDGSPPIPAPFRPAIRTSRCRGTSPRPRRGGQGGDLQPGGAEDQADLRVEVLVDAGGPRRAPDSGLDGGPHPAQQIKRGRVPGL